MTTIESKVRATPVAGIIGAEIHGVDLADDLDAEVIAGIWAELTRSKVVFFRDQHLDDAAQVAFARRMGPITIAHPTVPASAPTTRSSTSTPATAAGRTPGTPT